MTAAHPLGDGHFSVTNLRLVAAYLRRHAPAGSLETVLRRAGERHTVEEIGGRQSWLSYQRFRAVLEATASTLGGTEALTEMAVRVPFLGGGAPEYIGMLQQMGSADDVYASLPQVISLLTVVVRVEADQVASADWLLRCRFTDGFAAFPEHCRYLAGVLAAVPKLFGFPAARVVEEQCQCHGAGSCRFRVRWVAGAEAARRAEYFHVGSQMVAERLAVLQRTVADLVSDTPVRELVERVLDGAARAVRAPGFVLLLDEVSWAGGTVFGRGLHGAAVARVARDAAGLADGAHRGWLVAEIRSARRSYGRLVAVAPEAVDFLQTELATLRSYARLAAAALDSATALAEARDQAHTAGLLLELATQLAEASTTDDMAERIARFVPRLVGHPLAVVLLPDGDGARVAGDTGLPPKVSAALRPVTVPVAALPAPGAVGHHRPGDLGDPLHPLLAVAAATEAVTVPVASGSPVRGWIVVAAPAHPPRLAGPPRWPLSHGAALARRLGGVTSYAATALRSAHLHAELNHRTLHDPLTGLPNRTLIRDRIEQLLARTSRDHTAVAALHLGVDRFRDVNDRYGHDAGDQLLRQVADRLRQAVRQTDTVGRLAGDEFCILIDRDRCDTRAPERVADRLLAVMRQPFPLATGATPVTVTATIGAAVASSGGAVGLLGDADIALRAAKEAGPDRRVLFRDGMRRSTSQRLELELALQSALPREQFRLVYQPVLDLATNRVTGVEALLRWRHPQLGEVGPARFIPVLERGGLIRQVGAWVLHQACRQASRLHGAGCHVDVAVNISADQLDPTLLHTVDAALAAAGLKPEHLLLEITESVLMDDAEPALELLTRLKERGVRIAIDDFGTGYSSLAYVRKFPVDALKLDQAFVRGMADSPEPDAFIHTLVQLGRVLNLTTVAEGIEHQHQLDSLRDAGCSAGQGYLIAKPLEVESLVGFLAGAGAGAATAAGGGSRGSRA